MTAAHADGVSTRRHFAHALLVLPVGFWGLARLAAHPTGPLRRAALAALIVSTGLGLYDLHAARDDGATTPCTLTDLARVQALLAGRPFGYFAAQDRNWWLSRHAFLAGLLDARAVRLNAIDSIDVKTQAARFYGSARPLQLVPPHPGEAPAQWSLRLAQALGLHHLLEFTADPLPSELANTLRVELQVPGLRVFAVP